MITSVLALAALSQAPPALPVEKSGSWQKLTSVRVLCTGMFNKWKPADAKRRDQWIQQLTRSGLPIKVGNFISSPGTGVITLRATDLGGSYQMLLAVKANITDIDHYLWGREATVSSQESMAKFQKEWASELVRDWKRAHYKVH